MSEPDYALVGVTLAGSLLSFFGTTFILLCYLVLPHKQHIRHALIVNLTFADFLNALNNSASGLWVLITARNLTVGDGCTVNGFIGQLSVQAVDFSILTTTVVTLWIILARRVTIEFDLSRIVQFCIASWIVPIITSNIALWGGHYGPAASNWCWINEKPVYLRYVLTHGWRFAIIITVSMICIYIQIHLRRHMREVATFSEIDTNGVAGLKDMASRESGLDEDDNYGEDDHGLYVVGWDDAAQPSNPVDPIPTSPAETTDERFSNRLRGTFRNMTRTPGTGSQESLHPHAGVRAVRSKVKQQRSVEKAMLLHAYPIFYILLWIPGIAMRISQATGHDPYALQIMQASTQYIGFANALTFGWNEKIAGQIRDYWYRGEDHEVV